MLLNHLIGSKDRLRHALGVVKRRHDDDLRTGVAHLGRPLRHCRHRIGLVCSHQLPHPGRPCRLNAHIGLGQARTGHHTEQRKISTVGIAHRGHGLAFQILRSGDARALDGHQLGHRTPTQHRHRFHRHTIGPGDDGRVPECTAHHAITRTQLLGHVHPTAAGLEGHFEAFLGVVTALLGDPPGQRIG